MHSCHLLLATKFWLVIFFFQNSSKIVYFIIFVFILVLLGYFIMMKKSPAPATGRLIETDPNEQILRGDLLERAEFAPRLEDVEVDLVDSLEEVESEDWLAFEKPPSDYVKTPFVVYSLDTSTSIGKTPLFG